MYKISSVEINGFWQRYSIRCDFDKDVNIVIGMNGTGKTTFMNILHAVLSVDIEELFENDFSRVTLKLTDGLKTRTIKTERIETDQSPFSLITYQISTRKYSIPIFGHEEIRNYPISVRRRAIEEANKVKQELNNLVSLASLSVYRLGSDIDPEQRERSNKRSTSPVDLRLNNLMQRLTHYQLDLSTQARNVSSQLQRDVLASLLYQKDSVDVPLFTTNFDEAAERKKLTAAYKQLGVSGQDITRKILEHTSAISGAIKHIQALAKGEESSNIPIDLAPLEAYRRTGRVINLSLDASNTIDVIYKQIEIFLRILKDFIPDKKFSFSSGDLTIDGNGDITISRLSSGEKQLLILFIEALLQRQQPYIFLADEPELSLHISWQRNILPAIREIDQYAQIIVATHSPEVASYFEDKIIDMEDIRHV